MALAAGATPAPTRLLRRQEWGYSLPDRHGERRLSTNPRGEPEDHDVQKLKVVILIRLDSQARPSTKHPAAAPGSAARPCFLQQHGQAAGDRADSFRSESVGLSVWIPTGGQTESLGTTDPWRTNCISCAGAGPECEPGPRPHDFTPRLRTDGETDPRTRPREACKGRPSAIRQRACSCLGRRRPIAPARCPRRERGRRPAITGGSRLRRPAPTPRPSPPEKPAPGTGGGRTPRAPHHRTASAGAPPPTALGDHRHPPRRPAPAPARPAATPRRLRPSRGPRARPGSRLMLELGRRQPRPQCPGHYGYRPQRGGGSRRREITSNALAMTGHAAVGADLQEGQLAGACAGAARHPERGSGHDPHRAEGAQGLVPGEPGRSPARGTRPAHRLPTVQRERHVAQIQIPSDSTSARILPRPRRYPRPPRAHRSRSRRWLLLMATEWERQPACAVGSSGAHHHHGGGNPRPIVCDFFHRLVPSRGGRDAGSMSTRSIRPGPRIHQHTPHRPECARTRMDRPPPPARMPAATRRRRAHRVCIALFSRDSRAAMCGCACEWPRQAPGTPAFSGTGRTPARSGPARTG